MPRLTLIRHCATPLNEARKYQGHEDVGLSESGRAMARSMATDLAARGIRPERVWVSDLRRATETAGLVFPGVAQVPDARLRELDFGAFSGAGHDENLERHGDAFRRWLADPDADPPPGGERFADLLVRVSSWAGSMDWSTDHVVVLHVGSLKAVVAWALGVPFASVVPRRLPVAAVVELESVADGWRVVEGWPDPPPGPDSGPTRPGRGAAWPGAET